MIFFLIIIGVIIYFIVNNNNSIKSDSHKKIKISKEEIIADVIDSYCDFSILFIENETNENLQIQDFKLSKANKYQVCLLNASLILNILKSNKIDFDFKLIILYIKIKFINRFKSYSNEFKHEKENYFNFNNLFLNELNRQGDEIFLDYNEGFLNHLIENEIYQLLNEIDRCSESFEKWSLKQGKVIIPQISISSIYFCPFLSTILEEKKGEFIIKIYNEIENSRFANNFFLSDIIFKLENTLIKVINKDTSFIKSIKN